MKKTFSILLIVALLVTTISSVKAQFRIGAKGGFNLSSYSTNNPAKADMTLQPCMNFGAILNFGIIPYLSFQPEFSYYQKGATFKNDDYLSKTTINYLHVPLNLKLKVPAIPIYFVAGPYFGYALNGTWNSEVGADKTDGKIEFGSDKTIQLDYGVNFGAGYRFNLVPKLLTMFIETRYNIGLSDIDGTDIKTKNRNFGINTGILLNL